jgi:hypothetical protein
MFEDHIPMAAQHQRQAADNHNAQLQHGAIVAGIGAQFNSDAFWRGTGELLSEARVSIASTAGSSHEAPSLLRR